MREIGDGSEPGSFAAVVQSIIDYLGRPTRILFLGLACLFLYHLMSVLAGEGRQEAIGICWKCISSNTLISVGLVVKDFGIALIVVFGVALIVERPARRKLDEYNKKITENALESYLKTGIPPDFFDYLRKLVQDAVFVRERLEVTLRLNYLDSSREYVLVEQENSYVLKNNSKRTEKYHVSVYVEKPVPSGFDRYPCCTGFAIDGHQLSDADLMKADSEWPDTKLLKTYIDEIEVPAGSSRRVKTACKTVKYARDHYVWSSIHPATDLAVTVDVGSDGLKAFVSILHPDCLTKTKEGDGPLVSDNVQRPVMPGTAAEIVWQPV